MARKSIWMMEDDELWEVTAQTDPTRYVVPIRAKELRQFITRRNRLKENLYRIPIEKAILRYLEVMKNVKINDIITMTIEYKEKP